MYLKRSLANILQQQWLAISSQLWLLSHCFIFIRVPAKKPCNSTSQRRVHLSKIAVGIGFGFGIVFWPLLPPIVADVALLMVILLCGPNLRNQNGSCCNWKLHSRSPVVPGQPNAFNYQQFIFVYSQAMRMKHEFTGELVGSVSWRNVRGQKENGREIYG